MNGAESFWERIQHCEARGIYSTCGEVRDHKLRLLAIAQWL